MKYVLINYDEVNFTSYFFNFSTNSVYFIDKKDGQKSAQTAAVLTPLFSILFYAFVRTINVGSVPFEGLLYVFIVVLIGLAFAAPINYLIQKAALKRFTDKNEVKLSNLEIKNLFDANNSYRKKFGRFNIFFTLFIILSTVICAFYATNFILFTCNALLFTALFILIGSYRPILMKKFKKMIESYN